MTMHLLPAPDIAGLLPATVSTPELIHLPATVDDLQPEPLLWPPVQGPTLEERMAAFTELNLPEPVYYKPVARPTTRDPQAWQKRYEYLRSRVPPLERPKTAGAAWKAILDILRDQPQTAQWVREQADMAVVSSYQGGVLRIAWPPATLRYNVEQGYERRVCETARDMWGVSIQFVGLAEEKIA